MKPHAHAYGALALPAKLAMQRRRLRETEVTCPRCECKTMPVDLLRHLATRCPGRPPPHPASRWLARGDVLALGVAPAALDRWTACGLVRADGERVLERDVVAIVAWRGVLAEVGGQP